MATRYLALAEPDYVFEVVIVGDAGVGKSSVMCSYTDRHASTNGFDMAYSHLRTLDQDGKTILLVI